MAKKKEKKENYNELPVDKLSEMISEKQKDLASFRFKNTNNSLKDTSVIPKVKDEIARLKTAKQAQAQKQLELVNEGAKDE